jgi:hypothetical protein
MPDLLAKADDVGPHERTWWKPDRAEPGAWPPLGGIPRSSARSAAGEILGWFTAEGLDLKGIAPLLAWTSRPG